MMDSFDPDKSNSPEASLEDVINSEFCYSVFPEGTNARFIPEGRVERIISRDAVMLEFFDDKNFPITKTDDDLVKYVVNSAKKLFTISLICGITSVTLQQTMMQFKVDNFSDKDLPLRKDITEYPPCFKSRTWSNLRKSTFKKEQWSVLARTFPSKFTRLDLEAEEILPFTHVAARQKEGFFGSVYQVTIHSAHQEKPMLMADKTLADAAIKELKPSARGNEKWEAEWATEAESLQKASELRHDHIVPIKAAITKGKLKYFMFKWADGGSLRDLLEREKPVLTDSIVEDITRQIAGLAGALRALHNYQGQESFRHGDLKPENILIFKDETQVGTWTVADMGLAKHHFVSTALRGPTSTRYATPSYEAPEVKTDKSTGRSRLYDIWSMGCVTLELITWLLYGRSKLDEFNKGMAIDGDHPGPYYQYDEASNTAKVHPRVTQLISQIQEDSERKDSRAISDLLEIVSTKLLVVPLPLNRQTFHENNPNLAPHTAAIKPLSARRNPPVSTDPVTFQQRKTLRTRATAHDFCEALREVQEKGVADKSYWFAGSQPTAVAGPSSAMQVAIPTVTVSEAGGSTQIASDKKNLQTHVRRVPFPPDRSHLRYTVLGAKQLIRPQELNHVWEFPIDNSFAQKLLEDSRFWTEIMPEPFNASALCQICKNMDLWKDDFEIHDDLGDLEARTKVCEFCSLRWKFCETIDRGYGNKVHFDKKRPHLRLNAGKSPVLTIQCGPFPRKEFISPSLSVQIGLPRLPQAGTGAHIRILKEWLMDCDTNHKKCVVRAPKRLPTRLIYVGTRDDPSLRLHETCDRDSMKYFALSHPWGSPPHFCTYRSNIASHKLGISFTDLPLTFQNAVTITRDLGLEYLWIDSICIIQGPDGDFKQEATRMEDVFSNAYCVLAASSALGQRDGIIKRRDQRQVIMIPQGERPSVYVCDFMDNFKQHVLESNLSSRGWVLQERALARRTIYFTDHQTYWECGDGVRCETMTRMQNTLASFLGDPNFPSVAIESSKGGRIKLHQDMCTQYSRLLLTRPTDRPIAISGLEKRLVQSFGYSGGFGVLYDENNPGILRRSMLWHRASDCETMKKIRFQGSAPPTWSWMSYEGQIEYLDLPFNQVSWEEDFNPPWKDSKTAIWYNIDDSPKSIVMDVLVRDLHPSSSLATEKSNIIMDIVEATGPHKASKCVVLGWRGGNSSQQGGRNGGNAAVLLVSADTVKRMSAKPVFIRVGVASVPANWVDMSTSGVEGLLM